MAEIFPENVFFDRQNNGNVIYHNITEKIQNDNTTIHDTYPIGSSWLGAICCILFSIFGTTGNFISFLALVKCKKLRNATTAFIVNLCAADMVYCAITMPLMAKLFIDRQWSYGFLLCELFAILRYSNAIISIFSVIAIAINRYVLIVHPRIYNTMYNPISTAISIACLWIIPIIFLCLPILKVWGKFDYDSSNGKCVVGDLDGKSPRKLILFVLLILPIVSFTYCYLRIYCAVKKSARNIKKQNASGCEYRLAQRISEYNSGNREAHVDLRDKKEFRLLRICLVIFIIYMASTIPIVFVKMLHTERNLHVFSTLAFVFHYLSSAINPVIYIAMSREYRQAYKDLFTRKKF